MNGSARCSLGLVTACAVGGHEHDGESTQAASSDAGTSGTSAAASESGDASAGTSAASTAGSDGDGGSSGDTGDPPTRACLLEPPPATALVVGPGGFATIGEAVAAAADGDTIAIAGGTYLEQVEVDRAVVLRPLDDGPVWIDGECVRDHAIHVTASDATILGLGLQRTVDAGVRMDGAAGVEVSCSTIQDFDCAGVDTAQNRAGVAVSYGGQGHRILDNTIVRRVELDGGNLVGGLSNCIWFKSSSEMPSGGGHLIARNVLAGCYDGIGSEVEDDPRGGFDRDTVIEDNLVTDCFDDGIQVEGGTQDLIVRDNTIRRCAIGIANAPNLTGPITFENNTIEEGVPGFYGNVLCFKVGNLGTGVAYFTANRCVVDGTGWGETNPGVNAIVARENRISVGRYAIEIASPIDPGTSFDEDCLYSSDPDRFVKWADVLYADLAAFQAGAGQEAAGQSMVDCGDPG
jgi:hypothetical protein